MAGYLKISREKNVSERLRKSKSTQSESFRLYLLRGLNNMQQNWHIIHPKIILRYKLTQLYSYIYRSLIYFIIYLSLNDAFNNSDLITLKAVFGALFQDLRGKWRKPRQINMITGPRGEARTGDIWSNYHGRYSLRCYIPLESEKLLCNHLAVCVSVPPNHLLVFYAVRVVPKERRRLVLPKNYF
jgi:hypothetical protein